MNEVATQQHSLVAKIGNRYGVAANKLLHTLKQTAFQVQGEVTNEQMMALLVVADQYKLNPFTKELFAFPDRKNGIIPVVSIDGWSRILNSHPEFDGIEFRWSEEEVQFEESKVCPAWCECVIYRKDRSHPTIVRESLNEVYRKPFRSRQGEVVMGPWQTHTKRMLRHKAMIQCARIAFGFAGIYEPDEAERIRDIEVVADADYEEVPTETGSDKLKAALARPEGETGSPQPESPESDRELSLAADQELLMQEEELHEHEEPEGNT